MMIDAKYLIVINVSTAGLQDDDLGSDEEEVILFAWMVIDTTRCEILEKRIEYVRPKNKDINDNILSEMVKDSYRITGEKIKFASTLENVIYQLNNYINTHLIVDNNNHDHRVHDGRFHPNTIDQGQFDGSIKTTSSSSGIDDDGSSPTSITLSSSISNGNDPIEIETMKIEKNRMLTSPSPLTSSSTSSLIIDNLDHHHIPSLFATNPLNNRSDLDNRNDSFQEKRAKRFNQIYLITDGQEHLRQVIHPESMKKSIELPEYFYKFFDLRKEFQQYSHCNEIKSIDDMLKFLNTTESNENSSKSQQFSTMNQQNLSTICGDESIEKNCDSFEEIPKESDDNLNGREERCNIDQDLIRNKLSNMASIIIRMITDGHKFNELQIINDKLEPGICSKNEIIDNNTVIRARGLPWQSTDQDIANFFKGLNIVKGGVALCLSVQGRRNGEALVRFVSQEHRDLALKRHKHHIGSRYIEVYRASGEDFLNVAGGNNNEAQAFLSKGGQAIIRMRGLPYYCTAQQVIEFFANNEKCEVMHGEEGVLFVRKPDGRPTGDAFVLFETEDIALKALQKHRESIGYRYIELFRSTTAEVQQVFNRNMDSRLFDLNQRNSITSQHHSQSASLAQSSKSLLPTAALMSQSLIHHRPSHIAASLANSGSRKDCIKLRGLPYEAQIEQILEFLGEHSQNIVFQGVHMVYNAQGQPSGEAFIQMDSEQSALLAAQQRHHCFMVFGKKQRYIEVFQCSIDDMNLTSGGFNNALRPLLSSATPLLPAPFGAFSFGPNPHTVTAAAVAASSVQQSASILSLNGNGVPFSQTGRLPPTAVSYGTFNPNPFNLIYWPYPSPPVSPTAYAFTTAHHHHHHHQPSPTMINLRGLR
ncbi:hypothetical protein NH340_JMT05441 [Sarcoptes scabiei]|nr:hypothetical protein NH340_JMT05441 [Sarcoptes scabiei]